MMPILSYAENQRPVAYQALAAALRGFADEHGLPNAISPSELVLLMRARFRMLDSTGARLLFSRIFTSERGGLNRELAKVGLAVTGYGELSEGTGNVAFLEEVRPALRGV